LSYPTNKQTNKLNPAKSGGSNKYVGPYRRAEMYAGRVAYCPMVSHSEYADGTDRQTDGCQTVTLRFPIDAAKQNITTYTT